MATAHSLATRESAHLAHINIKDEVLEKVMIGQDLSALNAQEKVAYIGNLCRTLGLNPYTKPFEIMKFNGKEVPYARKDCAEQLRKVNNVSITRLDTKMLEGGIYVVTAYAERSGGVKDSSTGAICIAGLKGENLSNAIMKAETKAKRRVTLSICGLGFLDETEVDSIPNVEKRNVMELDEKKSQNMIENNSNVHDVDQDIMDISWAESVDNLQKIYTIAYKYWMNLKNKENMKKLAEAKDKRKGELEKVDIESAVETVNPETGEIA